MGVSADTRRSNLDAIRATVDAYTRGLGDPAWLHSFAVRESALDHNAEHDVGLAFKAYRRNWQIFADAGNPWALPPDDPDLDRERWDRGRGLFGQMVGNYLQRWDPVADPRVLHHPVVATVAAARGFNVAQQRGAENLVDVRQLWGTGRPKAHTDYQRKRWEWRREKERARFRRLGYDPDLVEQPIHMWNMGGFGAGPFADDYDRLWAIASSIGLTTDPARMPREWTATYRPEPDVPTPSPEPDRPEPDVPTPRHEPEPDEGPGAGAIVLGAAAVLGGVGLAAWGLSRRR